MPFLDLPAKHSQSPDFTFEPRLPFAEPLAPCLFSRRIHVCNNPSVGMLRDPTREGYLSDS